MSYSEPSKPVLSLDPTKFTKSEQEKTFTDNESMTSMSPTSHNEKSVEIETTDLSGSAYLKPSVSTFERDIEAQALTPQQTEGNKSKTSLLTKKCTKVDSAWPGRDYIKRQRKIAKRDRACCRCWGGLNKKQKGAIMAILFLAIVGVALGLGFGISSRVGGSIVDGKGSNKPINS